MDSSSAPSSGNPASPASVVGATRMAVAPSATVAHAGSPANVNVFHRVDPNTASLMMHPHAAAAMAAAAAAAVQHMAHQQQETAPPGMPSFVHPNYQHHAAPQVAASAPPPAVATVAAPHRTPHHPAPTPGALAQATNNSAAQQNPLAVMAALFGGATAVAGHAGGQPSVQVVAPSQMPYPMVATAKAPPPAPHSIPNNSAAVAAAAAQVVAAHSANTASSGAMTNALLSNVKTWKLEQLGTYCSIVCI